MSEPPAEDLLYNHVLGTDTPNGSLVDCGQFPDGWVDRYLELLASVAAIYAGQAMLPRKVVWAVHFASWYLPIRYEVWSEGGQRSNSETLSQLARLRTPSELFIADGVDH
ncbi:hypothetical protein [Bremerella sp. P1]|uniref:hypothetical protein n=1 Tax=Bremerella sp. P1 TaxID=3026424 RepID=UPI0023682970|nr:hypothetical protein [Bremerella sp. P1]WDI44204.1 hypothetical protein PSR63_09695 [Bremerella sp. P1]